jgi:hypothetical protein
MDRIINPQTNARQNDSANGPRLSPQNKRTTVLKLNLAKIYALADKILPDLADHSGAATISGWDDALAAIPTEWLDRTFSAAIRAHRGAFMVSFGEILEAWDNLLGERQAENRQNHPPQLLTGPRETYYVGNMLTILKAFCEEHRDPLTLPTRLKYALIICKEGGRADNFRALLESTGQDTLYMALTALNIAVDYPPPVTPGTVGTWAKIGDNF